MKILLAEDEKILRVSLEKTLVNSGHRVVSCNDGTSAQEVLEEDVFDLVLTDLKMPGADGLEILRLVKDLTPGTSVILMTAHGTVESAVEALKLGAHDYLTKPFSQDELLHRIGQLENYALLQKENVRLKEELSRSEKLIGNSPSFLQVIESARMAAEGEHTILIRGESGTGKELLVDMIHDISLRKDRPLVKVNCSVLPESLFESELFGYEKGAFTGASKRHLGRFERAQDGTLFLDDIDDLPKSLQVKLLRAIEQREIERLGGMETIPVNVRVVVATKVDLRKEVEEGRFRDDLYYRLNVVTVHMPPLRERRSDIPLLAGHFLLKHGDNHKLTPRALEVLTEYDWPGNVRELENVIVQMIVLAEGTTLVASLLSPQLRRNKSALLTDQKSLSEAVAYSEKAMILEALEKTRWRQKDAAEMLGIPRTTLRSKMEKYSLFD